MLPLLALMMMGAGAKNAYDRVQENDEDRAYTRGQHERTLRQQAKDDEAQAAMEEAAKPATVESAQLPGPTMPGAPDLPMVNKVKGTAYASMSDATKAANDFNAVDPVVRMSDALMKSGKPLQSLQLRTAGRQDQLGKLQLDEAQTAYANKQFNAALQPLSSHDALAEALNRAAPPGSPQVRPVVSADGKKVNYSIVMPDGTVKATQHEYDNTDRGLLTAKQDAMKDIPLSAKITVLHQQAMEDMERQKLASQERYQTGMLGVAQQNADTNERYRQQLGAKAAASSSPAAAPIWNDKADDFLKSRYTVKDEITGATSVDGAGMQFAKQIALAKAQSNGGDTTMALGHAFEVDNQLRAAAKGDPAKLNALRQQYIATVTAPAKAPAPPSPPRSTIEPRASMTQAAAPQAAPAPQSDIDRIVAQGDAQRMSELRGLAAQLANARAQLAAATRSGDANAVTPYARAVQQLTQQIQAAATQRFGDRANEVLSTLQ